MYTPTYLLEYRNDGRIAMTNRQVLGRFARLRTIHG